MSVVAASDRSPSQRRERAPEPLLSLRGLSKSFGGVRALDEVDLDILPGEVHGLLGENGSGKSTLIKVLSGFHAPDAGSSISFAGRPVAQPLPPDGLRRLGMSFVHQDLGLVAELSVTENLRFSTVVGGSRPLINWAAEHRAAEEIFQRYGLAIDPRAAVDSLNDTERALVAILRAVEDLGAGGGLLVLDEPTVFLPEEDAVLLFRVVDELVSSRGVAVLLVSHDLAEVLEHADRVTVLRGGVVQGTRDTGSLDVHELIELIVGKELGAAGRRPDSARREDVAVVRGLRAGATSELSFSVGRGEIVGITGLAGSGFEDVLAGIYGALPARAGLLELSGARRDLRDQTPRASIAAEIVYVPADRKTEGGVSDLSVEQNVTLPVLSRFRGLSGLTPTALRSHASRLMDLYDVRPRRIDALFGSLSGGNQQKLVLAKWLQDDPELILLQEPTQGVDVGARSTIFGLLRARAEQGVPIVCASSDYDQLAQICDRVIVMAHGRAHTELGPGEMTRELIAEAVISSSLAAAASESKEPIS